MYQFVKINLETGLFVEDAILNSIPMTDTWPQDAEGKSVHPDPYDPEQPRFVPDPAYVTVPCPAGFYWPRWDGAQWVEGKTPEEIAAIKEVVRPPTPGEQWKADVENALVELADMIAGGM